MASFHLRCFWHAMLQYIKPRLSVLTLILLNYSDKSRFAHIGLTHAEIQLEYSLIYLETWLLMFNWAVLHLTCTLLCDLRSLNTWSDKLICALDTWAKLGMCTVHMYQWAHIWFGAYNILIRRSSYPNLILKGKSQR